LIDLGGFEDAAPAPAPATVGTFEDKVTAEDLAEMGLPAHMIEKMLNVGSSSANSPAPSQKRAPVYQNQAVSVPAPSPSPSPVAAEAESEDLLDMDDDEGWGDDNGDGW